MIDPALRQALEARIGHTFRDPTLLEEALTHASHAHEQGGRDNERLEWLGDAVINAAISVLLSDRFPGAPEGELTRLRQRLVSTGTLARVGRTLGLGELLHVGRGEATSGGRERPGLLADATEAVFGALFREAGFEACRERIAGLVEPYVRDLEDEARARGRTAWQNPRGRLQELTQGRWQITPTYVVVGEEGPPHHPSFHAEVRLETRVLGRGTGRTKQEAFREAAEAALTDLGEEAP